MAHFVSASVARDQAQGLNIVTQEIMLLELAIHTAITATSLTATLSATTNTTINGTAIVGSVMTNADATGQSYYNVWQQTVTDTTKIQQMTEVIEHFTNRNYTVARKSTTGTEFFWELTF